MLGLSATLSATQGDGANAAFNRPSEVLHMATIVAFKKQGNKVTSWRAEVRKKCPRSGKTVRETKCGPRKTDLQTWATDLEREISEGKYGREAPLAQTMTVAELLDQTGQEQRWSKPRQRYAEWWKVRLGETKVAELTSAAIQAGLTALEEGAGLSGKPAKAPTRRSYLDPISIALGVAERRELITRNPMKGVQRPKKGKGRYAEPPTPEERQRLLDVCYATNGGTLGDLVLLAIASGGRRDVDLLSLRKRDVLFNGSGPAHVIFRESKGQKTRTVPVPGRAAEMLKRRCVTLDPNEVVFGWERFKDSQWRQAREEAGMPELHFHDLRHWAASFYAMAGASLRQIADLLGHSDLSMVLRYAHLSVGSLDEVSTMVAGKFDL